MNCERARDLILLFLAGELAVEEAEVLRPHLFACTACTRHMAETRRLLRLAQTAPEVEPAPGMAERTAATVLRGLRVRRTSPVGRLAGVPGMPGVVGVAAAVLVFLGLRFGFDPILDRPYDLSFLDTPRQTEPDAKLDVPTLAAVDHALDSIEERITAMRPTAVEQPASTTEDAAQAWQGAVGTLTRQAEILEWKVTDARSTRWGDSVEDIQDRLDDLASRLDKS